MACPEGSRYSTEAFQTAMENLELWEAGVCPYATPIPSGELVLGTVFYAGFALNIFIRTGSLIIPFVLVLILGGTVLAQMLSIINVFAGVIILVVAPLIVAAFYFTMDRRT